MNLTLHSEIESLRQLKVKELKMRYWELFGEPSPSSNRSHLFRRIAWRLQARLQGDLSARARQRAADLADDADLRVRAPLSFCRQLRNPAPAGTARDSRLPATGTTLQRSYQGRPIVVRVLEDGFEYNGKSYGSLSAVAHQVTGTRWNGFVFFRGSLKPEPKQ
jgi:Protein of unknown function (DUF2924)